MDEQRQSNVSKLWHKALLTSSRRRRRRLGGCVRGWGWQLLLACRWHRGNVCCLAARLVSCVLFLVCCLVLFVHIHNYQLRRFAKHNNNVSSRGTSGAATGCTQVLLCHSWPLSCPSSCFLLWPVWQCLQVQISKWIAFLSFGKVLQHAGISKGFHATLRQETKLVETHRKKEIEREKGRHAYTLW